MAKAIVGRLAARDLGNPKRAALLPDGSKEKILLGRILGIANGVKRGETKNGPYTGLSGSFEGIPAEEGKESIRAGICYLPVGLADQMAVALDENPGSSARFAVDIYVVKADNPQGYSYEIMPVIESEEIDPLADLRDAAMKALPAPTEKEKGGKKAT